MWVIGGAILRSYIGGALDSDNWNPFTKQYWKDGWQGAIVGGILGATAGSFVASTIGASVITVGNAGIVATKLPRWVFVL